MGNGKWNFTPRPVGMQNAHAQTGTCKNAPKTGPRRSLPRGARRGRESMCAFRVLPGTETAGEYESHGPSSRVCPREPPEADLWLCLCTCSILQVETYIGFLSLKIIVNLLALLWLLPGVIGLILVGFKGPCKGGSTWMKVCNSACLQTLRCGTAGPSRIRGCGGLSSGEGDTRVPNTVRGAMGQRDRWGILESIMATTVGFPRVMQCAVFPPHQKVGPRRTTSTTYTSSSPNSSAQPSYTQHTLKHELCVLRAVAAVPCLSHHPACRCTQTQAYIRQAPPCVSNTNIRHHDGQRGLGQGCPWTCGQPLFVFLV